MDNVYKKLKCTSPTALHGVQLSWSFETISDQQCAFIAPDSGVPVLYLHDVTCLWLQALEPGK